MRYPYGTWTHDLPHAPPHAYPTPDAAGVAAGHHDLGGACPRGRIILLLADGVPISTIAATVGISRRFVYKWAQRFLEQGVEGLTDKPGRGCRRRVVSYPALAEQHDMCA